MKISASIASAWWRGQKDVALAMINNEEIQQPLIIEKAFSYGNGAHTAWEEETKITKKLPVIFKIKGDFRVVETEQKLYKKINEEDWLSGKIDAIAIGEVKGEKVAILVDYKTGGKVDRWQSCVYHYLVHGNEWWNENIGIPPSQFWYLTLDKHTKETSTEIIKLTVPEKPEDYDTPDATTLTTGENFILTVLEDIKNDLNI